MLTNYLNNGPLLERANGRTIRTLRNERERPSDMGSGGLAARPILARNLMYCRRPDPAEVFHISVLALLMLFPLHRLVDRRTSLNAGLLRNIFY